MSPKCVNRQQSTTRYIVQRPLFTTFHAIARVKIIKRNARSDEISLTAQIHITWVETEPTASVATYINDENTLAKAIK